MERGELRWRLGQALRTQVDVARGIPRGRLRAFDASRPPLLFGRDEAREIRDALPRQSAEVLLAAEEFAEGRFRFLGYPPVELERPIAFDRDPFTGKIWPARHGLLLDYRSASIGDPKWIWELNRLQHVPLLLAAALTADRDDLAAVAVEDATTWLDQAKPGIGIAWSNGYEPALRAISIALTLDGLRGGGWGTSQLRARLLESLGDHVTWVQRYPSLFSSANNHRLGELAAIVLAAATAPELDLATQSSAALNELEARCREQFASDGGNREQAFGYMLFSTELLVVVAGALRASGQELPAWLGALFASVGTALDLHLAEFDPEPRYGDSDDGGPTLLGGRLGRNAHSVRAAVAWATSGEALSTLEPSALWFLGARRVHATGPAPERGWLDDLGLVFLRAGGTTLTFDVGAIGFGSLAAHGHADALHVTLAHEGMTLVGDPGTGSYFGSEAVRRAFRGTGFHGTLLVDGVDQSIAAGPFLWTRKHRVEAVRVDLARRSATAGHDGYRRLSDPVTHRRSCSVIEQGIVLVRDTMVARGEHTYSQRWPLAPGAIVHAASSDRVVARLGDVCLHIVAVGSAVLTARVREGSTDPLEGWWSEGLESIRPAPLVSFDASTVGGLSIATLLVVGDRLDDVGLHAYDANGDVRVAVRGRDWVVAAA